MKEMKGSRSEQIKRANAWGRGKIWLTPRVQRWEQTKNTHACEVHSTTFCFGSQNTKKKKKARWQRWLFTSFFWTHFGPTKPDYPPEVVSPPGRHRFLVERRTAKTHDCWAKRGRETKKSTQRLIKLSQINNNAKQMVRRISKIRLRFTKVSFPTGRPNMRSSAELCKRSINRASCKHFQILRPFSSHYLQGC